jgi:uncharacterized protein (DUF1800 family)
MRGGRVVFVLSALLFFGVTESSVLAQLRPKLVKPKESFESSGFVCTKVGAAWQPGKMKGKKVLLVAEELKLGRSQLKTAQIAKDKKKIAKYKKLVANLKLRLTDGKATCARGPGGGSDPDASPTPEASPTPDATPVPTPVPDQFSLEQYAAAITRADIAYLVEKAGYGLSSKEEPLVSIASSQGLAAAVAEFMRIKPEPSSLAARVTDRFDVTLGNASTQVRGNFSTQGYRQAALDAAINTNNPFRENLRHFFLNLWTVGAEVLSNQRMANNPQIPLWWDYWELLGRIANNSSLPDNLIEVSRHPFMLIYLDNDQNLLGNVNENYARELMELFSVGTVRIDPATGQPVENYVEYREGGNRTLGDIYRIATRLTGWRVSPLVGGDGLLYWRSVYSEADHDPVARPIFEGTPHAFMAQSDEDVIRGIFANHPGAPEYIAREMLEWYLTPQPPIELVREFAKLIKAANFKLDGPLAALLGSKAFHHANYKNKLAKNSFQVAVEMARVLELARDDIGAQNLEVGVNIPAREADIVRMGYATTNPPTVFFFPEATWTSAPTLIDTSNYVANLLADTTTIARLTSWSADKTLPVGEKTAIEVTRHVADRLGVTLGGDQLDQIAYYMNNTFAGTTATRRLYDNTILAHRTGKGLPLYQILAMMPEFVLK